MYDRPSTRNRRLPVTFSESIENRLQQIESTLKDMIDSGVDHQSLHPKQGDRREASISDEENEMVSLSRSSRMEITLDTTGRLDIDDYGQHNFHGHSSGLAFLAQIQQKYGELLGSETDANTTVETGPALPQIFDSRQAFRNPSELARPNLPLKKIAENLVDGALENVCVLSRIVHRPTFDIMFNRVYGLGAAEQGSEGVRFLPLLYAVMAVGHFAATPDGNEHNLTMSTA